MRYYFGEKWDAPDIEGDDVMQVSTPVGAPCIYCERPVVENETGWLTPVLMTGRTDRELWPAHRGCQMATTIGHLYGYCSCTGYDTYSAGQLLEKQANAGTLQLRNRPK